MKRKTTAVKKADSNTITKEKSQICSWFEYQCMLTGTLKPMNEVGIERLSSAIENWAINDTKALRVSQFYHQMGIPGTTWRFWCSKFPKLAQATLNAKEIIGERRELGALNHEYNTAIVAYTMPFYDAEWKDETVRRAALKEGGSEARSTVVVTMNPIPSSPLVPDRKRDE